ncbi:MAG: hypothetical protein LQ349_001262 [Xanthoria aureola]|nr:MAG: hypothetical protein LQ349_001262 [Xanthoria aureola]
MSGQTGRPDAEMLFCHQCESEWRGNPTALRCPHCDSEFVEVVENGHDPRDDPSADETELRSNNLPHHPLHHIHPWAHGPPNPEDGNIDHVEWNAGPGIRFSRTSYRSSSPHGGFPGNRGNDPFASLLQNMFDTMQQPSMARAGTPRGSNAMQNPFSQPHQQAPWPWQPHAHPFPERQNHHPGYGGRNTYTSTTRLWPSPPSSTNHGNNHLQDLLQALFQGIDHTTGSNGAEAGPHAGPGGFPGLHQLFASVLNPANAAHGDVVYSQEALDRIISQFMEQHNGSSAPGPASPAAISALPTKKVDQEILGSDGKAECSVCMDNVGLGDEVTLLPCQHWFHGDCIGAWLKEHDTCPHCRQGIMPKDPPGNGEATSPRAPGQEPRNSLPPLSPGADSSPGGFHFRYQSGNGHGGGPTTTFRSQQDLPVPRPRTERRRSSASRSSGGRNGGEGSSGGGGIGGAIGGWVRNHLGGGDRSSGR